MWISGSNNDQLGDTQAVIESQLMVIIGDTYEGYRVKLWLSHINEPPEMTQQPWNSPIPDIFA